MAETCEGLRAMSGKLNHLGLDKAPAKSTAGDGLRNRDSSFFETLYYNLTKRYSSFLSDSRTLGLTVKELFIVDSTTIRLFSDILKGVRRNPKNDGKKKGGLKVHMLIDAVQSVAKFVKITEAKMHDKNFLRDIQVPEFSMLVFDKAYNHYKQFAQWTEGNIYFVTRQKSNAVYEVLETVMGRELETDKPGVSKEENRKKIDALALSSSIVECAVDTARLYGKIKSLLRSKGSPIPENDIWIAALAQQHKLILVTRDNHFNNIEALLVENW